jgi:uncharacterized protein YcnI
MKRIAVLSASIVAALVVVASAAAHAEVSPAVALAKHLQLFTLAVPTEKANLTTTTIELTLPKGFSIDSFVPTPDWKRAVQQTGSGDSAVITKVTWTGGKVPTGEDSAFPFVASVDAAKSYTFGVKQTYSDNSVVDWSGPESSDTPAPVIEAKSSLGGGGTSTLAIVALVVGALGLVLGAVALATGTGARPLA